MWRMPVVEMLIGARGRIASHVRRRREERFADRPREEADDERELGRPRIQALTGMPMKATDIQLDVEENQRRLRRFRRRK